MAVSFVRVDVADLVFRVFKRPVHPELLDTLAMATLPVGPNRLTLRITPSGHAIEFRTPQQTVTELATSRLTPLPVNNCVVDRRLIGYRTHLLDSSGVRYQCSYQLETVAPDVFLQLHRELEQDLRQATLGVVMPGSSESSPDCLSLMNSELLPEALVIHSFHTFPDNAAILRIQTLFERS
jgi:hypothetical protein